MITGERIKEAAKRYLDFQGYEYIDDADNFLVYYDFAEDQVVFVNVLCTEASETIDGKPNLFTSSSDEELRASFEKAMATYYRSHDEADVNQDIRCDEVCLCIIGDRRALVRHYVNACGWRR